MSFTGKVNTNLILLVMYDTESNYDNLTGNGISDIPDTIVIEQLTTEKGSENELSDSHDNFDNDLKSYSSHDNVIEYVEVQFMGDVESKLDIKDKEFYSTIKKNSKVFATPDNDLHVLQPWTCEILKVKIDKEKNAWYYLKYGKD